MSQIFLNHFYTMSAITTGVFVVDKLLERFGLPMLPAVTFHTLELLGGSLASFVSQRVLRHKKTSTEFQVYFFAVLAMQHAAAMCTYAAIILGGVWDAHDGQLSTLTGTSFYNACRDAAKTEYGMQALTMVVALTGCLALTATNMVKVSDAARAAKKEDAAATATVTKEQKVEKKSKRKDAGASSKKTSEADSSSPAPTDGAKSGGKKQK